jgi:signal peptidase I
VVTAAVALTATVAVILLRRRFVVVQVVGESMEPVLCAGQRVLVRRTGLDAVERGDLVVFALASVRPEFPGDPPWMVKRAVAVAGDPVPRGSVPSSVDVDHAHVPGGKLIVRGDNAARSFDSRGAGFIDGSALLGVVIRTMH